MGPARQFAACCQAGSCRVVNADGPAGRDKRIGNERARGRAAWPLVQVARRAVSDGRGARIHWHASLSPWLLITRRRFYRRAGGWRARGDEGRTCQRPFGTSVPGRLPAALSPRSARDPQLWQSATLVRASRGAWPRMVNESRQSRRQRALQARPGGLDHASRWSSPEKLYELACSAPT